MLKLGKDVGVVPIKLQNHITNKEIDEILYQANDILYFFSRCYITANVKEFIVKRLWNLTMMLTNINLQVGDKKLIRREEIRNAFKMIIDSLNRYDANCDRVELQDTLDKMYKFRVANYLRAKDGMKMEARLKLIKENWTFFKFYGCNDTYKSVQAELLNSFSF